MPMIDLIKWSHPLRWLFCDAHWIFEYTQQRRLFCRFPSSIIVVVAVGSALCDMCGCVGYLLSLSLSMLAKVIIKIDFLPLWIVMGLVCVWGDAKIELGAKIFNIFHGVLAHTHCVLPIILLTVSLSLLYARRKLNYVLTFRDTRTIVCALMVRRMVLC